MTVQAGIEIDLDLGLLVGGMEAPTCEHSQHEVGQNHRDEPATHYARGHCECYGVTEIYAICPAFVAFIGRSETIRCAHCKIITLSDRMYEIVSPIWSGAK